MSLETLTTFCWLNYVFKTVQFLPNSISSLAVVLLQIDVLWVDRYFPDHMDDWTRPWGHRGTQKSVSIEEMMTL